MKNSDAAVSSGLLLFLPLVYVAWADNLLDADELMEIQEFIDSLEWLDSEIKEEIQALLDPASPPSASELSNWLQLIRNEALNLPETLRESLAQLGLELALLKDASDKRFSSAEAKNAMLKIEAALGVHSHDAIDSLLYSGQRPLPEAAQLEPSFDTATMQKVLDGEHPALRNEVRALISSADFAYVDPSDRSAYREQILAWCKTLAEKGYGALSFPRTYGGEDDIARFITVFETVGHHDLSLLVKFGVQFGLFGGAIHQLGTEKHHKLYLKPMGSLELPGCFAMTELGHGSNVRDVETTARYDAATREFVVHTPHDGAHKDYIGNAAAHGQLAVVFAQLEITGSLYGVHAFLVPIRDTQGTVLPGVSIEDCGRKMGLNGVDNGRIWFEHVRIPADNLLNRFADVDASGTYNSPIPGESRRFFTMLGTLIGGRVSVASAGISAAKSGLAIAIQYALQRRQFGDTDKAEMLLLDYRMHQSRLMPLLAKTYALHFAVRHLVDVFKYRTEENGRYVEALAAGIKSVATWHTTATLQTCRECCGGLGYLATTRLADLKADTDIFTTFEGDNTVLMQLVARACLADYKRQFSDFNAVTIVRFLAEKAATSVIDKNVVMVRLTSSEHLRSAEFLRSMFESREVDLIASGARRLKRRIDDGMSGFDAFNDCQDHMLALADAFVNRKILDVFFEAIEAQTDETIRNSLLRLLELYALHTIEQNSAWYQEQDYLEDAKAKAIRTEVNALCAEVRADAGALVESFGIPESCLRSEY